MGAGAGQRHDGAAIDRVLLAVEEDAAADSNVAREVERLRAAGYDVIEPPMERALGRPPTSRLALVIPVASSEDAGHAVQAAVRGFSVLAVNRANRAVADRLYDDLRRFGRLLVRSVPRREAAAGLDADERAILEQLAGGMTLGQAAAALHLSRRTADRRLAAARRALGAATTAEAIARLRTPTSP